MSAAQTGLGFTLAGAGESGLLALRRSTDGAPIAHVDAGDPPVVRPASGPAWRVEPFGRGWRLAAREVESGDVLCWYTPRAVRSGGELLLASDRAYAVRRVRRRRRDLSVLEGRERVLDARTVPTDDGGCRVELARRAPPRHAQDEVLIVSFLAVLTLLRCRASTAQLYSGPEGMVWPTP